MKRLVCLLIMSVPALFLRAGDDLVRRGTALTQAQCVSCHAIAPGDLYATILRDGPPLVYAGSKYRKDWLVTWLQNPARIRPAGYLPFRFTTSSAAGDQVVPTLLPRHLAITRADSEAVAAFLATLRHEPGPVPAAETAATRGEVHFQKILGCASCHRLGDSGGLSAPELSTAADRLDEGWMRQFIFDPTHWSPETMPRLSMRGEQLSAVVAYIRGNGSAAASIPSDSVAATPAPIPARRAAMLYQLYCSQCHGVRGNGKGINAPHLFIAPRDHTSAEEMGMLTDDRIFAAIKFGGTAVGKSALMPSWGGTIGDDDIRLLVGYVRGLSGAAP